MSSPEQLVQPLLEDASIRVYLYCRPITTAPPEDLPGIKAIADEYWSARICVDTDTGTKCITNWFSISKQNIQTATGTRPRGSFYIRLESMTQKRWKVLLANTSPVISIDTTLNDRTLHWLANQ